MTVTTLSYDEWTKRLTDETDSPGDLPNGWSPGGAASELGMTRQGIMYAINRGLLDAYRIPSPVPGPVEHFWIIPPAALDAYAARKEALRSRK